MGSSSTSSRRLPARWSTTGASPRRRSTTPTTRSRTTGSTRRKLTTPSSRASSWRRRSRTPRTRTKPEDWDDEDDGEWEPPLIDNPAFDASYIGYELWIVNNGTIFDNILVTDDIAYAKAQGEKLWRPPSKGEKEVKEAWDKENKPAEEEGGDDGEDGED